MIQDVLVFTPVYRLEPETVQGIMSLNWDGPLSVLFQRDNPTGNGILDHLHQYQRARETFLHGKYEAMLVIESDIIPPADTLIRLAALNADVAYGAYLFRGQGSRVVNILERYTTHNARNVGESLTIRGLWAAAKKQGVVACSGSGLGCVLIRRHVLESVPFRASPAGAYCDSQWTQDVYSSGFRMMADTAVCCGHKDTDGEILHVP
jgi:hypothetical protein